MDEIKNYTPENQKLAYQLLEKYECSDVNELYHEFRELVKSDGYRKYEKDILIFKEFSKVDVDKELKAVHRLNLRSKGMDPDLEDEDSEFDDLAEEDEEWDGEYFELEGSDLL